MLKLHLHPCLRLRTHSQAGLNLADSDISLIVSSPLTRCLQTAENALKDHPSWSTARRVVLANIAEMMTDSCDVGSSPAKLQEEFPEWDFSHLPVCWQGPDGGGLTNGIIRASERRLL